MLLVLLGWIPATVNGGALVGGAVIIARVTLETHTVTTSFFNNRTNLICKRQQFINLTLT